MCAMVHVTLPTGSRRIRPHAAPSPTVLESPTGRAPIAADDGREALT